MSHNDPREMVERCIECDDETGHAWVDNGSLYAKDGLGPYCAECLNEYEGAGGTK